MRLPLLIVATWLVLTAATPPARADYAADFKLLKQFDPVLKTGDIAGARKLIAAPNFRPLMNYGKDYYTLFEQTLVDGQVEIARLMMASPAWKRTKWNATNTARPLNIAASEPHLLPILRAMGRQKPFDLNTPGDKDGEFPVSLAASKDNIATLQWLVGQPGIRLNARNEFGQTALFYAGAQATVFLLSLGKMDANARDQGGMTPLHYAVEMKNASKVSTLLRAPGLNPNIRDKSSRPRTALDLALHKNNVEIAELLLAERRVRATKTQRALFKRMSGGDRTKSSPDLLPFPGTMTGSNDDPNQTPLTADQEAWQQIIERNDVAAARAKVKDAGFDPALQIDNRERPDFEDCSIFSAALDARKPAIALLMMDAARSDDYLAKSHLLERVGEVENLPVLKKILAKPKFDPNGDRNGGTPLFSAARAGNVEALKILLADPRVVPTLSGVEGATLLSAIAGSHSTAAAKTLLADPRINPMATDGAGRTALHIAVLRGDPEVLGALMSDARVDINARDESASPLQDAVYADLGRGPDVAVVLLRDPRIAVGATEIEGLKKLIENAQNQSGNENKIAEIKRLMAMRAKK